MPTRDVDIKVNVDASTSGAESKLSALGGVGKAAALGVVGVAAAVVGVGAKLVEFGERAATSNARISNITEQMGLFGDQADQVSGRLVKLAEATARKTGVDQNAIKSAQATLLTFGELAKSADDVGGNFDRATSAAVDLAAAGFGTAESNAVQLGKALNDPIAGLGVLGESGITFTEIEKKRIETLVESNKVGEAQALVLAAIEKQVGGTAEATAKGTDKMKVVFSQLAERLGEKLLPLVDKFATFLIERVIPGATRLGKYLAEKLGPVLADIGEFITQKVIPAAESFYEWFVEKIAPGIEKFVTPIFDGIRKLLDKVREAIEKNQPQIEKFGDFLRRVAEFVADKVLPKLGDLAGFLVGSVFAGAISGTIDLFGNIVDAIGDIIRFVDNAIGKFKELIDFANQAKEAAFGGDGAGVKGPSDALVDDLTNNRTILPRPIGGREVAPIDARTTVNVDGTGVVDEAAVARAIEPVLVRQRERLGRIVNSPMWAPS